MSDSIPAIETSCYILSKRKRPSSEMDLFASKGVPKGSTIPGVTASRLAIGVQSPVQFSNVQKPQNAAVHRGFIKYLYT